jgi:hypothetical protein
MGAIILVESSVTKYECTSPKIIGRRNRQNNIGVMQPGLLVRRYFVAQSIIHEDIFMDYGLLITGRVKGFVCSNLNVRE